MRAEDGDGEEVGDGGRARHRLAVEDRLDELDELRDSLPGRAPLLAAMLGAVYYYGGIFLVAVAGFLVFWSVAEREWLPGRLVGVVVAGGVGWAAFREGGELRRSTDARQRMIELEDELAELRGGERCRGPGRTGEAEDGRNGQTGTA